MTDLLKLSHMKLSRPDLSWISSLYLITHSLKH